HHTTLELLRNPFCNELRIEFGFADLSDVDAHVRCRHAHHFRDLSSQLLDILALFAAHDSRARGMNSDIHLACSAFDIDAAHRRIRKPLFEKLSHLVIRVHMRGEVPRGCVPLGCPLARNAETNSDWIDFLTHKYSLRSFGLPAAGDWPAQARLARLSHQRPPLVVLSSVTHGDCNVTISLPDPISTTFRP